MSPATQPYPRRWQALGVLALSLLVITMGNTILNVGLPTIREELDATSSQLQWIVDSYLLVFAGLLLAAGSLGDRFGRKRALLSGLTVFGLGSVPAPPAPPDRGDPHPRPRRDGPRRRRDHPDDALDPDQHLPARRAPEGDRRLGGGGRARHRDRPDLRRLPDRALRLEQHVPDQRARGGA